MGGVGRHNGGKMETTVLEQQLKRKQTNLSFETEGRMDADKFGNGELREFRSYQ